MKTALTMIFIALLIVGVAWSLRTDEPNAAKPVVGKPAPAIVTTQTSINKPKIAEPANKDIKKPRDAKARAPLFTLHGIYLNQGHSLAFIRINNANQRAYYVEQEITDGYMVKAITADHVIIEKNDITITLRVEKDSEQLALSMPAVPAAPTTYELAATSGKQQIPNPNIKQLQPNHFQIDREFLIEELGKLDTYKSTHIVEDPEGFFIERVYDDSPFQQIGIRPGDVIHKINDKPLKNVFDLLNFYEKLDTLNRVEILITRKLQTQIIYYDLN